jgi:hypothetical protein
MAADFVINAATARRRHSEAPRTCNDIGGPIKAPMNGTVGICLQKYGADPARRVLEEPVL